MRYEQCKALKGEVMDPSVRFQDDSQLVAPVSEALWFLAYTKPRQETVAQFNLERQAFETYLPLFKTLRKSVPPTGETEQVIYEPMFARYVFFRPSNSRQSLATARSTRGLSSIVSFGFEMATIQPDTVAAIRACEQERNATDVRATNPFQTGDRVRLRADGMQSLQGLVYSVSSQRVKLLVELLGQQKLVSVKHHQLEFT
jgi:transcriptional antiterminator RfaH